MSQARASHAPALGRARRSRSSGSGRRPQTTTRAPSAASSSALARPRPEPPPLTIATWPSSRPGLEELRRHRASARLSLARVPGQEAPQHVAPSPSDRPDRPEVAHAGERPDRRPAAAHGDERGRARDRDPRRGAGAGSTGSAAAGRVRHQRRRARALGRAPERRARAAPRAPRASSRPSRGAPSREALRRTRSRSGVRRPGASSSLIAQVLAVEAERDVVRRLGARQLLELPASSTSRNERPGVRVEHHRQDHAGVLGLGARLAHEDRLARDSSRGAASRRASPSRTSTFTSWSIQSPSALPREVGVAVVARVAAPVVDPRQLDVPSASVS